jgi:hypothetical protein
MVNLGALAMPEKIIIDLPNINFDSKYTDLLMILRQYYYNVFILDVVWLQNKNWIDNFYYYYDITTNFYKTKDEQTGIDSIIVRSGYPSGIKIFLGRYYI